MVPRLGWEGRPGMLVEKKVSQQWQSGSGTPWVRCPLADHVPDEYPRHWKTLENLPNSILIKTAAPVPPEQVERHTAKYVPSRVRSRTMHGEGTLSSKSIAGRKAPLRYAPDGDISADDDMRSPGPSPVWRALRTFMVPSIDKQQQDSKQQKSDLTT